MQTKGAWPHLSDASEADISFAIARITGLENKKKNGQIEEPPLSKVKIEAKKSFGSAEMEYLGQNIYSSVQQVNAGYQKFVIFNQEHWLDIPASDDNREYRILLDISSTSKPELIVFRNSFVDS